MKVKALTLAVIAAASQNALAIDPSVTPDVVFRLSGATAAESLWRLATRNEICDTNNPDIDYLRDAGGTNFAVYCLAQTTGVSYNGQVSTIPASLSGKKVLFLKHGFGGSASGVQALINPIQQAYVDRTTCPGAPGGTFSIGGVAYDSWTCGTSNAYSHAGFSDVNPELFRGDNKPFSASAVTPAEVSGAFVGAGVQPKGVIGQAFSLVASTNLWNAMQTVQVAQGSLPATCNPADTSEACTPSISKELAVALMSSRVTNWNNVNVTIGGSTFALTGAPGVAAPTNTSVKICRRVNGSGTQATINANVLDVPCLGASATGSGPTLGNTPNIFMGSGSGDVERCLQAWNTGTSQSAQTETSSNPITFSATVNGGNQTGWAIGPMSTERNANANYRFLKLDGIYPSAENAQQGKYKMWGEGTFQFVPSDAANAATIASLGGLVLTPGTPERDFADYIKNAVGKFGNVASINNGLPRPAYLALSTVSATPANAPTAAWNPAQPVIGWHHNTAAAGTGNTDNCRIPSWNSSYPTVVPMTR